MTVLQSDAMTLTAIRLYTPTHAHTGECQECCQVSICQGRHDQHPFDGLWQGLGQRISWQDQALYLGEQARRLLGILGVVSPRPRNSANGGGKISERQEFHPDPGGN